MSRLTEAQFDAAYNDPSGGSFPNNAVRAITEAVIRQFGQDIKDSFVFAKTPTASADATLAITSYGIYVHTGTGSTWTLLAGSSAIAGKPFVFANIGSVLVTINDNGGTPIFTVDPGTKYDGFWDEDNSQWIIY